MKMRPPDPHVRIEKEGRGGEGAKRGKDGEEEGGLPAVRGLSDRSRKVAEWQNSSKSL